MAFLQEYTMLDELGKGGFATVYKVRHNGLGYIRAIRVLNETIVNSASETYQKFLRECRLLLRLGNGNHPNIVHIYQPRLLDNKALVEMDYVDGQDILHYLKQNQNLVPAEEVVRMAEQISSALAYCHEGIYRFCMDRDLDNLQDDPEDGSKVLIDEKTRNRLIERYKVIHNDIHSGNIMRREDGNFVLLDFGLAINGDEVVRSSRHTNGAPEFKAPEKWDDESILTEQSDIYSFGIVMYQYLAGRVPFPYNTHISAHKAEYELGEAHQKALPPSIEAIRKEQYEKKFEGQEYVRDFPQWLEDAIMRCLRKNPSERFRNGKELYDYIVAHAQTSKALCNDVELERLESENKELASQINDLRNTNHTISEQLSAKEDENTKLSGSLQKANKQIQELNENAGKKSPALLVLMILFAIWGAGISLYHFAGGEKVAVSDSPAVIHDTIYRTASNAEVTKKYEDRITQLNKQISEYKTQVANYTNLIKQKESEISNLNSQLKQKSIDLEKANKDLAALKKSAQSGSSTSTSADVSALQQQIRQKDSEITRLKKELENKATALEKANKEIAALKRVAGLN